MNCQQCKKGLTKRQRKFCSRTCAGLSVGHASLGIPSWNKGLIGYNAGEKHHWYGRDCTEENNPAWKGQTVGYRGLHIWVQKILGKPARCSNCGCIGYGHQMHWANKSGEYKREKSDWLRLCVQCHKAFDKINLINV